MTENPTTPSTRSRVGLIAALLVVIGGVAALVAYALQDDEPQQLAVAPATAVEDADTADVDEAEPAAEPAEAAASSEPAIARPAVESFVEGDDMALTCVGEEWEPTEEELAASRAEAEGLAAVLAAAGIEHTIESDPMGFAWVEYDDEDGIAQAVANSYYRTLYPEEWAEPFEGEPYEVPEEELAHIREENAALTAVLDEAGIAYELITDEGGWEWVEWDYEDRAAQEAVDAYYAELFGDEWIGEGEECIFPEEEWIPTDEDIARAEAEVAEMSAVLEAAGVAFTIVDEGNGMRWVEFDYDDPAAMEAMDAYWMAQSSEWAAEISADLDRLAAAFDAAGIDYVREGHDECETIIFDTSDPAALAAVASIA